MSQKVIKKRCGRCDEMYNIVFIRESKAKRDALTYTPCTFCGYIAFGSDLINRSGRCKRCSIPFAIVEHRAKNMCNRCYHHVFRNNATNNH